MVSVLYYFIHNILLAILKYISIEEASIQVDINGADIFVGSILKRCANMGRLHPINLATTIVIISVIDTTIASFKFLYIRYILKPLMIESIALHNRATLNSLKITLKKSVKWISSTESPRIIKVELCEPQLPPVPISMGINDTNKGIKAI